MQGKVSSRKSKASDANDKDDSAPTYCFIRTQTYEYEHVSSNRYVHKTKNFSAYSYEYHSSSARLFARAPKPKFSDAALRLIASKPPLKMWVVKKN